jgi:uncharacterized protein (TIGR03437 family)
MFINVVMLLACFGCIYLGIFVTWLARKPVAAAPLACSPPLYQGYVNSCSGLRLLWLPGSPVSQIDHMELKRYKELIASNLPPNTTGYSDLQGCDFAASYEIIQVMKDGTRCSTITKGMLPHSFPCDKCVTSASLRLVNAASFTDSIAPSSIATVFGSNLTTETLTATSRPTPTTLGNTRVIVNGMEARLLFVSPQQINLIVPDNAPVGSVPVVVYSADGSSQAGVVSVQSVQPGVFTMQANGSGVAAALTTQDGSFYQPVGNPDGSARAISVGSLDHPTWLALFGTGVRGRTALSEVTVRINGINCAVAYAGTQSGYDGLDQLNVQLPQSLRNSGDVAVEIIVNGLAANRTRLLFGG